VINVFLRVGRDMKILPVKKYLSAIQITDEISRQAQGWKKSRGGQNTAGADNG
jgi:hypothetical protein